LLILINGLGHLALDPSARGGSVAPAVLEVAGVSVLGALVAFVVVRLAAGRLARLAVPQQLLVRAAHELANLQHRALRLPTPEDDALAMLTEEFNDVLQQVGDQLLGDDVQSSGEIVAISDPQGCFSFVNRAFLETFGYAEDQVLGRGVGLVLAPGNPPALLAQIREATVKDGWNGELRARRKDGKELAIALRTSPIRDERGGLIGLVGMAHDVTERQQAEERQRLLEAALKAAVDAVMITDRAGVIEWVNPAFTWLTGYALGEAVGQNPRMLKSGAHDDAFYSGLWADLVAGRV